MMKNATENVSCLDKFTLRKVQDTLTQDISTIPDSLQTWITHYLRLAVSGVLSEAMTKKIALHLSRFHAFFVEAYGHDRISTVLKRDVVAWQNGLKDQGLTHREIGANPGNRVDIASSFRSRSGMLLSTRQVYIQFRSGSTQGIV
jgi:hypothetical protein